MESLKIDRSKLRTFKNYAKEKGYTVQRIYQLVKEGSLKTVEVDGVKFIKV
jgi:predicted transcriptional regulator